MTPEESLYLTMVNAGMKLHPGTLESLRQAIRDENIYFFEQGGVPSGFVTWYFEGKDLVMNNLCFWNKKNKANLFCLRKLLHEKYPNLSRVKWLDEKKGHEVRYEFR